MCLLTVCNSQKIPTENFYEAAKKNSDGIGFAWFKENKVYFKKGFMKVEDAWEYYKDVNIFPHIVHFRLGNPTKPELTHPFIISNNSLLMLEGTVDKVLFHNGIITAWKDNIITTMLITKKVLIGDIIDTRLAAVWVNILGDEILKVISGKFVTLTGKDNIINIVGDFKDDNGILYSNETYKPYNKNNYQGHYPYGMMQQRQKEKETIQLFDGFNGTSTHEIQTFII